MSSTTTYGTIQFELAPPGGFVQYGGSNRKRVKEYDEQVGEQMQSKEERV